MLNEYLFLSFILMATQLLLRKENWRMYKILTWKKFGCKDWCVELIYNPRTFEPLWSELTNFVKKLYFAFLACGSKNFKITFHYYKTSFALSFYRSKTILGQSKWFAMDPKTHIFWTNDNKSSSVNWLAVTGFCNVFKIVSR